MLTIFLIKHHALFLLWLAVYAIDCLFYVSTDHIITYEKCEVLFAIDGIYNFILLCLILVVRKKENVSD